MCRIFFRPIGWINYVMLRNCYDVISSRFRPQFNSNNCKCRNDNGHKRRTFGLFTVDHDKTIGASVNNNNNDNPTTVMHHFIPHMKTP